MLLVTGTVISSFNHRVHFFLVNEIQKFGLFQFRLIASHHAKENREGLQKKVVPMVILI